MRLPRRVRPLAATVLLALASTAAAAETAYVIDKLLVGLHAEKALDSEIVKVLPTGIRLEVLQREGELAQVREPDGATGWVDAAYLMPDPPAALRVDELEAKNKELTAELTKARERLEALQAGAGDPAAAQAQAALAELRNEMAELQKRLASERLRAGELQARVSELQGAMAAGAAGDDELRALQAQNAELRSRLAAMSLGSADASGESSWHELAVIGQRLLHSRALVIALLALVAIAFALGVYLTDYLQRRRHGGFRV